MLAGMSLVSIREESQSVLSPHRLPLPHCVGQLRLLDAPPVSEGDVVLGAGQEDHEGEGGHCAEDVDDGEGEEEGGLDCQEVRTGGAGVDELPLLPQGGLAETEAGLGWPGGRGGHRGGAVRRAEGHQVEAVGDGGHEAEHGGHQGHQQAEQLTGERE